MTALDVSKDQGVPSAVQGVVSADLRRLDSVRIGLGDEAAAYVLTGAGETVLSTLSTLCKANLLEVCERWARRAPRRVLLARGHPYLPAVAQRYTEVLCAASAAAAPTAVGTAAVPALMRVFFTEAFFGLPSVAGNFPQRSSPLGGQGLVLDVAVEMTRRLGGNLVDLVDVLYVADDVDAAGKRYREVEDLRGFFSAHADVVVAAAARLPAQARADLLSDLREWDIARGKSFTRFLVKQAGDGSKAVREAAVAALATPPADEVGTLAAELLAGGDATQRSWMVDLFTRLELPGAPALLAAHREKEKTASIVAAIDTALARVQRRSASDEADGEGGYTSIDGRRIAIPPLRPLPDGPAPRFGDPEAQALTALIAEQNEWIGKHNQEAKARGYKYEWPTFDERGVVGVIRYLNGEGPRPEGSLLSFLSQVVGRRWMTEALGRLPFARAIPLARNLWLGRAVNETVVNLADGVMSTYLRGPGGDLRTLEALDVAADAGFEYGPWEDRRRRPARKGDFLRFALQEGGWRHAEECLMDVPEEALWPYLAENLAVFDEALGLAPPAGGALNREGAIRMLARLPATPARYYAPLLNVGAGEVKVGRKEARALLAAARGVEKRLIALLEDSRQGVRTGAAEWLAARGAKVAVTALRKRLSCEKSELVRAAMLTALGRLGEDVSQDLSSQNMLAEAEKGLKSVKGDRLVWLRSADLALRFRSGERVPSKILRWWGELAVKLKQPGGNALFEIYLDQLVPEDAQAFSTWVLESWIAYDTVRPSEDAANAYARQHAPAHYQAYKRYFQNYTEEKAFAALKAQILAQYPNSGADTKGVLALAVRTPSALAAERVRAYLKAHGARTSQAAALLQMLAGIGDPVALQVVIAASLRLKQKSVQKLAGELVTQVAEARDWTLDELADRTVPTAGFDEHGVLLLPCGEEPKPYEAHLAADLSIQLRNPAGKEVAALPSGQDKATQDSKKQLSAARKALKQIIAMQSGRLYEALCAERSWVTDDWCRSFHAHPVMRRLIHCLVWVGVDSGGALHPFRPTAEGDFTDADDKPVDLAAFSQIRLAHGALLDDTVGTAWEQHLNDYEVMPLFTQFGRELLRVSPEEAGKTMIEDRRGWVTDAFTIRRAATRLGYERGPPGDGGRFAEYRKAFQSLGLVAVIEFTGNSLPEQNVPAALIALKFEKASRYGGCVKLSEVPAVLLSECWNDYHAVAATAAYDPEWDKRARW